MLRSTRSHLSQYASYRYNARLSYWGIAKPNLSYFKDQDHDFLAKPKIDKKFKNGNYVDETVDLRDKEHLELSEAVRLPKEKDFYQDHTYHEEWIRRDLTHGQKQQILKMYKHLVPGNAISPWIWFPGDIVEVMSGPFAGQRGAIVTVLKYKNEVMVQNVNVQSITIPATESRPEQIMQREHPIDCLNVKHVDPTTNEVCDVRMINVRDKETGKREQRRVSLASGVLLPIPSRDGGMVYEGDPLHDTPLQDAEEDTYDEATELPVIIERKLKALEDHFVEQLRVAHEFHREHEARNAASLGQYQRDVLARAKEIIAQRLLLQQQQQQRGSQMVNENGEIVVNLDDGGESPTESSSSSSDLVLDDALIDHILMSNKNSSSSSSSQKTVENDEAEQ